MSHVLANVHEIAYDFDGVFYPEKSVPDLYTEFAKAKGQAAHELTRGKISIEEGARIGHEGYIKYRDSVTALSLWAAENGFDKDTFRTNLFRRIHEIMFRRFQIISPETFAHKPELVRVFQQTAHIQRGIATHGCTQSYVPPLLDMMGVLPFIDERAVLDLSHANFNGKNKHPTLVRMCLDTFSTDREVQAYVEDSLGNLEVFKEHEPSVTSVYIHHGNPLPVKNLPSYVDFQCRDLIELGNAHLTAMQYPRRAIHI